MLRAAQQQIQRLYERGSLSYPRTDSDALTQTTIDSLGPAIARFVPSSKPVGIVSDFTNDEGAHEALHPMPDALRAINLAIPEWMLDIDDRLIHRIARNLLRCAAPIRVQEPLTVEHIPAWAQDLPWSRPESGTPKAALEPDEIAPRFGITMYDSEEIAFRVLIAAGLGRPSSLVGHAEHAAERGVVNTEGLSAVGEALLRQAPVEIADPETSRYIERVLDQAYRAALKDLGTVAVESETMDLVWAALHPAESLRPQLEAALRLEERRRSKPLRSEPAPVSNARPVEEAQIATLAHRRAAHLALEGAQLASEPEAVAVPAAIELLQEAANADTVEDSALIRGPSTCRLSPTP